MKVASFIFILLFSHFAWAQEPTSNRTYTAIRTESKPKIDGILTDEAWCMAAEEFKGKFTQISPNNGTEDQFESRFLILYDDKSIYIAAELYDENPDQIPTELSTRDNLWRNSDYFGIVLDTYKKGQNGIGFFVSSSGVQTDMVYTNRDNDRNWDAVWKSAVKITDRGWSLEMEIPYQAIRFPEAEIQEWGMNLIRRNVRLGMESSWNFVDRQMNGFLNQAGTLHGIKNIDPPVRLSLMPYVSSVYQKDQASGNSKVSFNGGMDVKYGINESFTMDMTLIPDFSNVRSDNQVLNLSPFEVRYDENRPFFTEGTELFNMGGLFYSRRVGQTRRNVSDTELNDNEIIVSEPTNAPLINASKVSGRTIKGLGVGVFNAISRNSVAFAKDTITGIEREIVADPFTNYNVTVLDQNLKNNSNIGLINTNVYRSNKGRNANVTLAQASLRDKTNTWSLYSQFGYGHLSDTVFNSSDRNITDGFKYTLYFSKVSGNFQFNLGRNVESDTWNINELGYMRAANEVNHNLNLKYNIYKPFGKIFNSMYSNLEVRHSQLYKPGLFQNFNTSARARFQFVNFWDI
ncbi:MAG: carbohydrate binding family 9 domain-containing protein, partial [Cyclobacteriaceae bacterium]|nr:carbohydrate binding family 9 domain-containing protein [Cyclobacteriaceae bacterium]